MRTIQKTRPYFFTLTSVQSRAFSYQLDEVRELQMKFNRKLNILKLYAEKPEFNYEQPQMIYDKKTGDVTILDTRPKNKKIIKTFKDLDAEKKRLFKEIGLNPDIEKWDLDSEEKQSSAALKME